MIGKFSKSMILRQKMRKIVSGNFEKSFLKVSGNFEKVFSNARKIASKKVFRHFLHANLFMFILFISNHTAFSLNLELICT